MLFKIHYQSLEHSTAAEPGEQQTGVARAVMFLRAVIGERG
jgi:hypothetical protein